MRLAAKMQVDDARLGGQEDQDERPPGHLKLSRSVQAREGEPVDRGGEAGDQKAERADADRPVEAHALQFHEADDQELPDHELPDQELPLQELPDQELPDHELPLQELPDQELPDHELPLQELPDQELPDHELPDQELPFHIPPDQELPAAWAAAIAAAFQRMPKMSRSPVSITPSRVR